MKKFVFARRNDTGYIADEDLLKKEINSNRITEYDKLPLVKVGDYVICCHRKSSIDPYNNARQFDSSSWKADKIVKVDNVVLENHIYYVCGRNARGGIYCSGVRFMTPEEIKTYEDSLFPKD